MKTAQPASTADLLDLVVQSGIFQQDDLGQRVASIPRLPTDPLRAANLLVDSGVLTRFQARFLLAGKYKGFKVAKYVIRDQLGKGGMGTVYLAEHQGLRRSVALKVLARVTADNAKVALERFLREARAAAALDHPNIVRIYDAGQHGEFRYLVMEYIDGVTLDALLSQRGALAPSRAVAYVAQAAAGLQHAHERGFVHRDIKPANLILSKDGVVKILDMGLARSNTSARDRVTEALGGTVVATIDYVSPEQALGTSEVDIRSDIYSLGATFFALVTGRAPFDGDSVRKLAQLQMKKAPCVTTLDKTFPPELARVVAKMLAKKPEERYQTPGEVITDLAPWLSEDESARIVAGLSGTNLAGSGTLQSTLNGIAKGPTKQLDTRETGAAKLRVNRKALLIGVPAGLLVFGLALYLGIGSGGKKVIDDPVAEAGSGSEGIRPQTTTPQPPAKTPRPRVSGPVSSPAAPPAPKPPVTPARPLFRFLADQVPECRFTVRGSEVIAGEKPQFPTGINLHCWKPEWVGTFVREAVDGRPAVGLVSQDNSNPQLSLDLSDESGVKLARDVEHTVRIRYLTRGGVNGNLMVQNKDHNFENVMWRDLPDTAGTWQTLSAKFLHEKDFRMQLTVNAPVSAPGGVVYVRAIEIDDPASIYRLDLSGQKPFNWTGRSRKKDQTSDYPYDLEYVPVLETGDGELPLGWMGAPWKNEAVFEAAKHAGSMALGTRHSGEGQVSGMLFAPELAYPNGRAVLRFDYLIDGPAPASLRFKRTKPTIDRAWDVCLLPATGGVWRTFEIEVDLRGAAAGYFEVHNRNTGPEDGLWIRSFDVRNPSGGN
jgi:serine/threonine protein kinase